MMKGASLGYLTREGFRNIWVNRLLSLATVVVLISCLIIVGSGALIFFNISSVLDLIEGQNVVMVYVQDEADEKAEGLLKTQLMTMDNIEEVVFVSREEAFERQKASYGEDARLLDGLDASILPNAFKVTVKDLTTFDSTVAAIKQLDNVLQIRENSELAGKLSNIRDAVTYISLGVIAILFFVSLFIGYKSTKKKSNPLILLMYFFTGSIFGWSKSFERFEDSAEVWSIGNTYSLPDFVDVHIFVFKKLTCERNAFFIKIVRKCLTGFFLEKGAER